MKNPQLAAPVTTDLNNTTSLLDTANMSTEDRLKWLETNVERLNHRQSYQEHLHRNVREDGNIAHYWNMTPTVAIAAVVGTIIGFALHRAMKYLNN